MVLGHGRWQVVPLVVDRQPPAAVEADVPRQSPAVHTTTLPAAPPKPLPMQPAPLRAHAHVPEHSHTLAVGAPVQTLTLSLASAGPQTTTVAAHDASQRPDGPASSRLRSSASLKQVQRTAPHEVDALLPLLPQCIVSHMLRRARMLRDVRLFGNESFGLAGTALDAACFPMSSAMAHERLRRRSSARKRKPVSTSLFASQKACASSCGPTSRSLIT